uniref:protein O-mannosyl-transferase 2-like isoform X2 n=1 Tax=Ciona intestinalis TaxID=7719 RepID=UPI000180C333|nr:protein O-mannosyl-transferase 2-like isoform X2 [Ciona intestinalis]|eukprot:XP_002131741.1 protein O-mannosyl-transferase 2-like isoform X2 [Ciona intestinalis]
MLHILLLASITFVTICTRLYRIEFPNYVTWDETHFGKMAGLYMNRTFFFDVHPPLGKMIIAFTGYLSGYKGVFPFSNPGDPYYSADGNLLAPYITMRAVCAIIGCLVVPVCFMISTSLCGRISAALLTSVFLVFDTGMITISQYILLDQILLFFISCSVCCAVKMNECQGRLALISKGKNIDGSFSPTWWLWLVFTGVSLGCAISVKLVGCFTMLFVGMWTVVDLWNLLGEVELVSMIYFTKHLLARVVGLIITPTIIYISVFYLHLDILHYTGGAEIFFSTSFQATLEGSAMYNTSIPAHVSVNSTVALRAMDYEKEFLHSHAYNYPDVTLQQVTGYAYRDQNNWWKITRVNNTNEPYIRDGDIVHLTHASTMKRLTISKSSYNAWMTAFVSKQHLMMSAFEPTNQNTPGADQWKVELKGANNGDDKVCALDCGLKLVNVVVGCCVHLSEYELPEWAARQREITCTMDKKSQDRCLFSVETRTDNVNGVPLTTPTMNFIEKFIESHKVMLFMNNKIKPVRGERTSKAWYWPISYEGQMFSKNEDKIMLIGTPLVWHLNCIMFVVFGCLYFITYVLKTRGYVIQGVNNGKVDSYNLKQTMYVTYQACTWCLLGWFIHYAPFFLIKRVLYLHHYFPAHIFACLLSGILLDFLFHTFSQLLSQHYTVSRGLLHTSLSMLIGALVVQNFYLHQENCYGRYT